MNNSRKIIVGSLVVLIAAIVRIYHLGYHSLWLDEIGQVVASRSSWWELLTIVGKHLSPPLDYLLLKPFLWLGDSDYIARFPAFLYGVGAVPIVFLLGKRLGEEDVAAAAALMLALSPMAIAYSQEARMYSLFLILSLVVYILTLNFIEKPSLKSSVILGIANSVLVLTHYFGIAVLGLELIVFTIMAVKGLWKKDLRYLGLVFGLPIVFFIPWVPFFLKQIEASGGQIGYALPTNKDFFKFFFNAFSIHTGGEEGPWYYFYILAFLAGTIISILNKNVKILLMVFLFFLSILGAYAFSFIKPIVTTRNLIFLLPIYLLVCAYGITWLMKKINMPSWTYLVVWTIFMLPPVYHYHFSGRPDYKPNWKGAAAFLKANMAAEDKVLIPDHYSRGCLTYYLEPESKHVFMRSSWEEKTNRLDEKVWLVENNAILDQPSGWLVLPPQVLPGMDREKIRSLAKGRSPSVIFKTQGKGNPLEIFRIN